jgi:MFS transporter, PAT family, beta-lactamase induction signal transducer AmpG
MQPQPPTESIASFPIAVPTRSKRTLLWTSTTYFGEGLPWSFLHQMGTEFLTAIGASKTQIGATSLLHLAVTFKFAWGPVVDLFGRKRTWLLVLQFLLGLGMFVVAAVAPTKNLTAFWWVLGVLAVVHATHDIACDGFYLQVLDRQQQALFAGVRTAAFRGAMIVGSSPLVYLAGKTNWLLGFGAAGVLMILVAILNAIVIPRPSELPPRGRGGDGVGAKGPAFWAAYRSFFAQPQAVLVLSFMFFYKLGDIMMFAMSKPLLRDIGIDTAHRGILNGLGTASFILASILGGAFIARHGLSRCLVPMTYLQNLAIPLYIGMAVFRPHFGSIVPIVLLEQFASGVGASAHVVFLMQRCRSAFSASHYAFATAVVALGSTLSGFLSGPLNERLGHPLFFTVAFIASVPSLVLVLVVPRIAIEPAIEPAPAAV